MTWPNALKASWAQEKRKGSGSKAKSAKKKQSRKTPVKAVKSKAMPQKRTAKRTAANSIKSAKKMLEAEIGTAYVKKFKAPTKTARKKAQKNLSAKQSLYNRLSK